MIRDYATVLDEQSYADFAGAMRQGQSLMRGRTLWHINATLKGGGVAELLGAMLPYLEEAGIASHHLAMSSTPEFLDITKRLHNWLHGFPGDSGPLGEAQKKIYTAVNLDNVDGLLVGVKPGDVVFIHDPQPAGLIPHLKRRGAQVVWHCHIGTDTPNDFTRQAWRFLLPEVSEADAYVFSRPQYLWDGLDSDRLSVIQPSIDPFATKNSALSDAETETILRRCGFLAGAVDPTVSHLGGSEPVPGDAAFVVQTARWDKLKDHIGVLGFFADHLASEHPSLHLVLSGPTTEGVSDDPEGASVVAECLARYEELPPGIRTRVHLISCPMTDLGETDEIVNAMQRRAEIVFHKSLAEGFGLAVAEAMWKSRPVIASRVGGIQDQIESGRCGVLIDDPHDGAAFARAASALLRDPEAASRMGQAAYERVRGQFLMSRQLTETMQLLAALKLE